MAESAACYHFVIRDACRIVGEGYRQFARKLWLGAIVISGSAFCSAWAVHQAPGLGTFPRWICSGCASIAAVALSAWVFWFREEERSFARCKGELGLKIMERALAAADPEFLINPARALAGNLVRAVT